MPQNLSNKCQVNCTDCSLKFCKERAQNTKFFLISMVLSDQEKKGLECGT